MLEFCVEVGDVDVVDVDVDNSEKVFRILFSKR